MIGRSHSKGVVLCYHYEKALATDKMVQTIETAMSEAFLKLLAKAMDGCARQSSKKDGGCWCTCI